MNIGTLWLLKFNGRRTERRTDRRTNIHKLQSSYNVIINSIDFIACVWQNFYKSAVFMRWLFWTIHCILDKLTFLYLLKILIKKSCPHLYEPTDDLLFQAKKHWYLFDLSIKII